MLLNRLYLEGFKKKKRRGKGLIKSKAREESEIKDLLDAANASQLNLVNTTPHMGQSEFGNLNMYAQLNKSS